MGISLARNPNQRQSEIPQDRGRIGRRIQDRVRGTECGGRFTSDHQRTNSSAAVEGDQFRDSRSTLSTTRNAGHFLQEIANAGRCGRGREPQIVCHAGHLRGLSAEVDSAALEVVSSAGRKGRAGRAMAEIPSAGTWQQGQTQKHHERFVQPRHSAGNGRHAIPLLTFGRVPNAGKPQSS